jgi:hypothetical protein
MVAVGFRLLGFGEEQKIGKKIKVLSMPGVWQLK